MIQLELLQLIISMTYRAAVGVRITNAPAINDAPEVVTIIDPTLKTPQRVVLRSTTAREIKYPPRKTALKNSAVPIAKLNRGVNRIEKSSETSVRNNAMAQAHAKDQPQGSRTALG